MLLHSGPRPRNRQPTYAAYPGPLAFTKENKHVSPLCTASAIGLLQGLCCRGYAAEAMLPGLCCRGHAAGAMLSIPNRLLLCPPDTPASCGSSPSSGRQNVSYPMAGSSRPVPLATPTSRGSWATTPMVGSTRPGAPANPIAKEPKVTLG